MVLAACMTTVSLAALAACMSPYEAMAAGPSSSAPDSVSAEPALAASTAPPWNPPAPVAAAEPWEKAIRFPLKVAAYPFSLLGRGTRHALLHLEDYHAVARVESLTAAQRRIGLFEVPSSLGDRTGLGMAVQFHPPKAGFLFLEASGSLERYSRVRASVSPGPTSLSYRSEWRPQDQFFGLGPDTEEDETESNYAVRIQEVQFALSGVFPAPAIPWLPHQGFPDKRVAQVTTQAWIGPRAMVLSDGRDERVPPLSEVHPAIAAAQFANRLESLVYGGRVKLDARSGIPHWGHGGWIMLEAERHDRPVRALALRDAHTPARPFTRLVAEMETAVSWWRDPRTLRLRLRTVAVRPDDAAGTVPLPELARLGASAGLAGFEPGRFHDTHSLLAKLSYLFPLARFFEFDVHAETGGVFPNFGSAPRFDDLATSVGVALRPRGARSVMGKFGVDVSRESVRFGFTLGNPE